MDKWIVDNSDNQKRLLTFLKERLREDFSTTEVRWAVEHNRCRVNRSIERFGSRRLNPGDQVEIEMESSQQKLWDPALILYEDEHLLCYNKPAGITSEQLASLSHLGLVHRLDRDTTGVFLLAKTSFGKETLENLFKKRLVKKSYLALVKGSPSQPHGVIENWMGKVSQRQGETLWGVVPKEKGVYAKTEWEIVSQNASYTLIRCFPYTGRTHQIRVHLKSLHFPIVGDFQYGSRTQNHPFPVHRPLLHAYSLEFHPPWSPLPLTITAPLAADFSEILKKYLLISL